jgi:hypothetical protein
MRKKNFSAGPKGVSNNILADVNDCKYFVEL